LTGANYFDTFISVADDSPVTTGTNPPVKPENSSIVARQFAMISDHPYLHTSEDVIFNVHADRAGIGEDDRAAARLVYFSMGRPCLRASDLGKKYGWGIHCDHTGHVALYGVETPEYSDFIEQGLHDGSPKIIKAMRSSRN
jgi:hypothetical protein